MKNAFLVLQTLLFATTLGTAAAEAPPPTITVHGEASVRAVPDMAVVHTGVVSRGATAAEALEHNNSAMERILDVLQSHQIAEKDLQTSGFQVQPEFEYKREQPPKIIGYRVSNSLVTNVRELSRLATILDALVKAGSNQIAGIQFKFKDAAGLQERARREAFRDARTRARLYAEVANVTLGGIRHIAEEAIHVPVHSENRQLAAADSMAKVPIAVGENELRATVTVVFAIKE